MAVDFAGKVFAFTGEKALFSAPCHVLVGVSGGADSMALLHLLTHWPVAGVRVSAVHIHHGLRGDSADRDEQFVRQYCADAGIDLTVYREDVSALAEKDGLTIEEAGRRIRYADFEKCRKKIGADYILTAHTASDQVETVLMRMVRGTGVDGLAGIPAVRGAIRRPLLGCNREEVEAYCREKHLDYIIDETNADVGYTRNRIRHEVMPLLRRINPAVDEAILRLSSSAADDSAHLWETAGDALSKDELLSLSDLKGLSVPIRRRVIIRLLSDAGVYSYDQSHLLAVESLISNGCGMVRLPGGISAVVLSDRLCFLPTSDTKTAVFDPLNVDELPFSFSIDGHKYTVSVTESNPFINVHNLFFNRALDYDKIQGKLYVRGRREGDWIHPAGRGVGKSLKKLMNEYKISVLERERFPLLCDDVGVVLIPGYTCDERVKITADTKHFLVWNGCTE